MKVIFNEENKINSKDLTSGHIIVVAVQLDSIKNFYKLHMIYYGKQYSYIWLSLHDSCSSFGSVFYNRKEALEYIRKSKYSIDIQAFTDIKDFKEWLSGVEI